MIVALKEDGDPLAADYDKARDRAEAAARIARSSGDYPLLSSGDINIYALFVERAFGLIRRGGMAGLLVPSGIAADKGASRFFGGIATTGRLAALLDFENKGFFFPHVHNSFKFCAFIAGGPDRRFDRADCAFFLHRVAEIAEPGRTFTLSSDDFRAVNPNTGTAPVFRTARDAAITTAIYRRVPVLVDRSGGEAVAAWPVQYFRMFDMTNDSGLDRKSTR